MKTIQLVLLSILLLGLGHVSAAIPRLHTCGKNICDPDDNIVVLRGVALADAKFTGMLRDPIGGNYSGELADTPENQLKAAIRLATDASKGWHSNVVRIPIHPIGGGWPFAGWNEQPSEWTSFIDAAVEECVLQDVYCLLDYHAINNWNYAATNYSKTMEFWNWAAPRYKDIPNILFELYNEPVSDLDCSVDDCGNGGDQTWSAYKDQFAQPMVDAIRNDLGATETFIYVSNPMWSHSLSGISSNPIDDPSVVERIGYTLHIYPWHWYDDPSLSTYLGETVNTHPIIVTEFGYQEGANCPFAACDGSTAVVDQEAFGTFIKDFMKTNTMSWTAWSFDNAFESIMWEDDQFTILADSPGFMGGYVKDFLSEEKDNYVPCDPCGLGKPTAHAGADQVLVDSDGVAGELVTLTGSGTDEEGTIVSYEWREGTVLLASSQNPEVTLTDGVHILELTVIDNDGLSGVAYVTVTVLEAASETCDNILSNGDFDNGLTNWDSWYDQSAANVNYSVISGELFANISSAGVTWSIQTWNETSISNGVEYKVTYSARATANREIELMVEQNGSPYQAVTSKVQAITTTMQRYSHTFTSAYSFSKTKVGFKLGGRGTADVYFDDVVFAEASTCSTPDAEAPTVPTNVNGTATGMTTIALTWTAATDNIAVVGYDILVNGVVNQSLGSVTASTITGLSGNTQYALTMRAKDAAGNISATSSEITVVTDSDLVSPTVPTSVNAVAQSFESIIVTWNASTDNVGVVGYDLYIDGILNSSLPVVTSTSITGLSAETAYAISLRAVDAASNSSALSAPVVVTTEPLPDTEAPTIPAGVSAEAQGMTQVLVQWSASNDNVGVTGYMVYLDGILLQTIGAVTSTSISGLTYNTEYSLSIRALDAAGNMSAQSTVVQVTTDSDTEAPTVPTGLAVAATEMTKLTIAWTPSTDNIAVGLYRVYIDGFVNQFVGGASTTTLTGLVANTAYRIRISAQDASGNISDKSVELIVTTAAEPQQEELTIEAEDYTTKASAIQTETTSDVGGGLNIGWISVGGWVEFSDQIIAPGEWEVQVRTATWSSNSSFDLLVDGARKSTFIQPTSTYTGSGSQYQTWATGTTNTFLIDNGDTHTVRINFLTGSQNLNWIRFVPVAPADTDPPTQVTGLSGFALGLTGIDVSWNPAVDNVGVVGYDLYVDGSFNKSITGTNTSLSNLTYNTTYSLSVQAKDAVGNKGLMSAQVSVTTDDDLVAPTIPTGIVASPSVTSFDLNWNASTDNIGVVAYDIYVDGVFIQTTIATAATILGLTEETPYTVVVYARDASGNSSSASTPTVVTTLGAPDIEAPSVPVNISALATGMQSVNLSWDISTDNVGVAGYRIYTNGILNKSVAAIASTTLIGLTYNTEYSITIGAFDAAGNVSSQSGAVLVTTDPDSESPTTPTALSAVASGSTSISVSWSASSDNIGVTGYDVYVDGVLSQALGVVTGTSVTSLDSDTEYSITVQAKDASGNSSALTAPVLVTTDQEPQQTELLVQVEDYTAKHSSIQTENTEDVGGGKNIGWIEAGRWVEFENQTLDPGTWKMEVRIASWSTNRSTQLLIDGVAKTTFTKSSATYTGSGSQYQTWKTATSETFTIASGTSHTVRLVFSNGSQNINWVRFVPVIPDTEAPATVTGLVTTQSGTNSIALDWNTGSDNVGVIGYDFYQDDILVATTTSSQYTVTGLSPLTSYDFKVKARDAAGNSSIQYSAVVTGTTTEVVAVNIIDNGDFSSGESNWDCSIYSGSATCDVVSGEYLINITNDGSSSWHIQPRQGGFTLQSGKTYTFAFDARATVSRTASIKIETDGSPWTDYSNISSGAAVTTTMNRYAYTFTMPETANARVVMNIGNAGTHGLYVDNVWLVEGNTDPCNELVGCP
ncbi:MAG: DUF5010 C-terminal domain-containing protein [Reichenbachiella sp.]